MHPASLAIGATVPVFLALTWQQMAPSSSAYAAIGFTAGMAIVLFAIRRLWRAIRLDVVTGTVIVVTGLAAVLLPVLQWAALRPSLFLSSAIFGGLALAVVRHRIPEWIDARRDR